ncbi:Hypp2210 [Branchiostoma lanceolatum]|uniref:Hypp2210 protein n=1 Tax=Branchiostoma lanceolatum TaxID=7740 RepID=A0A8J9ZPE4_BRALA|nr:Hypp2210 [Branchiostoma lanceolatum]
MEARQTEDVGMQWDSSEELSARSHSNPVTCATELEGEETTIKIPEQISDVGDDRAPGTSVQMGKSSAERSSEEKTHGIPQSDKKNKKKGEVIKLDETTIPKFPDGEFGRYRDSVTQAQLYDRGINNSATVSGKGNTLVNCGEHSTVTIVEKRGYKQSVPRRRPRVSRPKEGSEPLRKDPDDSAGLQIRGRSVKGASKEKSTFPSQEHIKAAEKNENLSSTRYFMRHPTPPQENIQASEENMSDASNLPGLHLPSTRYDTRQLTPPQGNIQGSEENMSEISHLPGLDPSSTMCYLRQPTPPQENIQASEENRHRRGRRTIPNRRRQQCWESDKQENTDSD